MSNISLEQPEKLSQPQREAIESTIREDGVEAGIRMVAKLANCSMQQSEEFLILAGVLEAYGDEESTEDSDNSNGAENSENSVGSESGSSEENLGNVPVNSDSGVANPDDVVGGKSE